IMASRFSAQWAGQRGASFLKAIGHLRSGAQLPSVQAEMSAVAARVNAANPQEGRSARGVLIRSFQDMLVRSYRLALVVLLCAVSAVLLIACANIANLLLARGTVRRREIAVRTALGASRGQIVRQLLSESLVLAAVGGVGGTLLAWWGVDALVRFSPLQIPRLHTVHIDRSVLAFTVLATMVTGVLCGMVPAIQLSRANPGHALKDGDRGGSGACGGRTRQVLVVAEVALSLVLLVSAGLRLRRARRRARARRHRHQRDDGGEDVAGRESDRQGRHRQLQRHPAANDRRHRRRRQAGRADRSAPAADVHAVRAGAVAVSRDGG